MLSLIRRSSFLVQSAVKRRQFKCLGSLTKVNHLEKHLQILPVNVQSVRCKKTKGKNHVPSETDSTESDNIKAETDGISSRVLDLHVNSLRADLLVKAGLGVARNKVENLFYENKIRVNGEKLLKKAEIVSVGDELDVIKGPSPTNPNFLTVARLELLTAKVKGEGFAVKIRRFKSLTIEPYEKNE